MADVGGLSKATISRIWQTFGLQSHRVDTFKLSADPQFVEKVRDIVGLYLNPPDHALVLSLDEKSQVQALDRRRPLLPMTDAAWIVSRVRRRWFWACFDPSKRIVSSQ